jgi:hypothetical protein
MSIFLVTFLNCSQVLAISNKLQNIVMITPEQKIAIVEEFKKVVPTCPVVIKNK